MSSFHQEPRAHDLRRRAGSTSQLIITNPTGSPPAKTARYQGLGVRVVGGVGQRIPSDPPTNRSCPGSTREQGQQDRLRGM